MTVNAAYTKVAGKIRASTAGPMSHQVEMPGPYAASKQLDETAAVGNAATLTAETDDSVVYRLKVPKSNDGVYFWMGETHRSGTDPEVTATTALWLDPGETTTVFLPFGWKIVVADALP